MISEAQSPRLRENNPPPDTNPVIRFFVSAFFTLSTERSMGSNVMGMIPYSKIVDYSEWVGFEDVTRFLKIIQAVDSAYVGDFYKKMDAQRATK